MDESNSRHESDNLLFRLILLTRRWRQFVDGSLQSSGLTDATWRPLLHLLWLGDGIRQKDLAESIGIKGPSLVRILDTLIDKDYIRRIEDIDDRRVKRIYLTKSGREMASNIRQAIKEINQQVLAEMDPHEVSLMVDFTRRLEAQIEDFTSQGQ